MFVAAIASVASTALGVAASMATAGAKADAAKYNQQVENANASMARHEGMAEAADKRIEMRRHLGAIRAAYGGAGLDFSGSPLDVLEETAHEYSWDVAKINYRAEVKAVGAQNRAELFGMEADAAKTEGMFGIGSALLGGVSDLYQIGSNAGWGTDLGSGG